MEFHCADIGVVLGNGGEEEEEVVSSEPSLLSAAALATSSCGDGRQVVRKGVMVNVSSATRLDTVGCFFMEKAWLLQYDEEMYAYTRQVTRRALVELEAIIIMVQVGYS